MSAPFNTNIARMDNRFVFHARYNLSAKEAKIILFLISRIDPLRQQNLIEQTISVKELESFLKKDAKRWGSFYKELRLIRDSLVRKGIYIPTEIQIEGKHFDGYINWFQEIMPVYDEAGNIALRFLFAQSLQPFLLNLKQYVAINLEEVIALKSSFSIRIFQIFRAYRDKFAKHQQKSKIKYELDDLKTLLGIANKYHDYRNFKKRILDGICKEINQKTSLSVNYHPIKEGRQVKSIQFEFWEKRKVVANAKTRTVVQKQHSPIQTPPTLSKPSSQKKTVEDLSFAGLKAFQLLTRYGVKIPLALDMVAKVQGSEIIGFQDWYFEEVIRIFESKTNQTTAAAKTGTLVNWFLKKRIFEQGDHFAVIMERLQGRKKKLQTEQNQIWDNRIIAKGITAETFRNLIQTKQ